MARLSMELFGFCRFMRWWCTAVVVSGEKMKEAYVIHVPCEQLRCLRSIAGVQDVGEASKCCLAEEQCDVNISRNGFGAGNIYIHRDCRRYSLSF